MVSFVSWDSQLPQISHLCSGLLPLLPDVHSESSPKPFVPRRQCPLHFGHSEVANPAADKHLHFLHHSADVASTVALCKKLQLFFCLVEGLSVSTDIDAVSILAQTKSKKLEFLPCKDTGHLTLFRVHFQLQFTFQILPAGFQQAFCCALAFGKCLVFKCVVTIAWYFPSNSCSANSTPIWCASSGVTSPSAKLWTRWYPCTPVSLCQRSVFNRISSKALVVVQPSPVSKQADSVLSRFAA